MPNVGNNEDKTQRRKRLLDQHFHGWNEQLWSTKDKGFVPLPRTLPLIGTLLRRLNDKKKDLYRVYHELWFRAIEGFVDIRREQDHAYACGFTPGRGVRSWRERIVQLERLGFVRVCKHPGGDGYRYIFLPHPDMVIQKLDQDEKLPDEWGQAYQERMGEIHAARWQAPRGASVNRQTRKIVRVPVEAEPRVA